MRNCSCLPTLATSLFLSIVLSTPALLAQDLTLRIATYNILDKPTNASERADMEAIISAIGNESVFGHSGNIDIMAFQEGPNSTSVYAAMEASFETVYGDNYEIVYASADSSGDRTGVVYNATKLHLISSQSVDNLGFTHQPMLATFRPHVAGDSDEFSVLSVHLKAGTTNSDFNKRETEAMRISDLLAAQPTDHPMICLGDFNMKGSYEDAWPILMSGGLGETLNAPFGFRDDDWNNSIAFQPFHTQDSTGTFGGMDDRFDLMLITPSLLDHMGIEYQPGSLTTFGNNGTHNLNGSIFSGSGGAGVQNELVDFSDHLPVFADFRWCLFGGDSPNQLMIEATDNFTVRTSGPRTGSAGSSEFQVEGSDNGNFACFGVLDFDLSSVLASGHVGGKIQDASLDLRQLNASFTNDGPVSIYLASPAATGVVINSGIQYQGGNDGLDCLPSSLSAGAQKLCTIPAIHHNTSGGDLPDGTLDQFGLYDEPIKWAITDSMLDLGNVRLLVVPEHPDTAATYAGNTDGNYAGPTLSGLYQAIASRPSQTPIRIVPGSLQINPR